MYKERREILIFGTWFNFLNLVSYIYITYLPNFQLYLYNIKKFFFDIQKSAAEIYFFKIL